MMMMMTYTSTFAFHLCIHFYRPVSNTSSTTAYKTGNGRKFLHPSHVFAFKKNVNSTDFQIYSHASLQRLKIRESNMTPAAYVRASTVLLALTVEGS